MAGAGEADMLDKAERALAVVDVAIMCNIPPEQALDVLNHIDTHTGLLAPYRHSAFTQWTAFGKDQRDALKVQYLATQTVV